MTQNQELLKIAWHSFVAGNDADLSAVRPIVRESWERCRSGGVNPYQKVAPKKLAPEELEERLEKNHEWLQIARPVMKTLDEFVAGSGFVVVVADNDGYLLEVIGDKDVVQNVEHGNFVQGADWSELSTGTGGVGTALVIGRPFQVFGYEHYCICSHGSSCSAAPIHDPDGKLIGILDMTGSFEKVHLHTLGMVVAGADAIERQIAMKKAWRERDAANKVRDAMSESISEGILVIDRSFKITHLNRVTARLLGITQEMVEGKKIKEVLDVEDQDLEAVIHGKKLITDQEANITTPQGRVKLLMTSRPINSDVDHEGAVMVLNESIRAQKLTQRMSGAVARLTWNDVLGEAPNFLQSMHLAKAVAGSDSTVLLLGETGTGKDVFAEAIHNASQRAGRPFVVLNCGAIPRTLIESELFGYSEGAFTGAKKGGSPGMFELANGGTIFLDEIGDMPLELQTTLLRVLEQKTITRIGSCSSIPVDVRVIAATNRDLISEVSRKNFRQDLFFRLNVVTINLPPLRTRKGDIEILLFHFLNRLGKRVGKNILEVDERAMSALKAYSWPGNVRELQNVIERALNIVNGTVMKLEHLPGEIRNAHTSLQWEEYHGSIFGNEKQVILKLLEEKQGNLTQVAAYMGIARTTLYRRMAKYGLPTHYQQKIL